MNRFYKLTAIILVLLCISVSLFPTGNKEAEKAQPTAEPAKDTSKDTTAGDGKLESSGSELFCTITGFEDSAMVMRPYLGGKSKLATEFSTSEKKDGKQSVMVTADTKDWTGIEIVVPEGKGDWSVLRSVRMWVKGNNSGTEVKVVFEDVELEQFTQSFFDNFTGWKQISLPISGFKSRTDWQAAAAKLNQKKDWPIKFFHYFTANGGNTVMYFDTIIVTDEGRKKDPNEKEEVIEKIVPAYKMKDLAADYNLKVGAAASAKELKIDDLKMVLLRDFNSFTPGNAMKFYTIKAEKDSYNFTEADELMKFAEDNKMELHGHTLVWHSNMPDWVEKGTWTKAQLLDLLKEFITTVVTRYKGKIGCWDVVNEPFAENGDLRSKDSVWARVIGEEYIEKAFIWAHEADPAAKLYINDYNVEETNSKSDAAYNLIKKLKAKGVPIHGFGMQFHLMEENAPMFFKVYNNVKRFTDLGLDVQFTEVDVRIKSPTNEAKLKHQAEIYGDIFNIAIAFPKVVKVTVWGVSDASSWIPTFFPGYNDALLFDKNFNPKPAYNAAQIVLIAGPQTSKYEAPEAGRHVIPAFKANKTEKAPVLDGKMAAGEWDAAVIYPFACNQLSATDQRLPAKSDLDGNWRILYSGNTLYGAIQRIDDTTNISVESSWENDCVEVFFGIDKDFVQLRTLIGKDFEGSGYKGAKKAVWSANGDLLEFSIVLPPADIEGRIIGWNIALADNDGGTSREHQVYPITGSNIGYKGADFTEIEFVKKNAAGERLGISHVIQPFKAALADKSPTIDGKIDKGEWDKGVVYQFVYNQLSAKDLTNPAPSDDLYGEWKILYNGKTLYGIVQRKDDKTVLSAGNVWENDTVEVFFDLNGTFAQLRVLAGKDFESHAYKGAKKAVWSANGDILEFSIEMPADSLKGLISGFSIALADNDGGETRELQLYPFPGANVGWKGLEFGEIIFE